MTKFSGKLGKFQSILVINIGKSRRFTGTKGAFTGTKGATVG